MTALIFCLQRASWWEQERQSERVGRGGELGLTVALLQLDSCQVGWDKSEEWFSPGKRQFFLLGFMQRKIHFDESSRFCSIHADLLYSSLATQLLRLLLWSSLGRARGRETGVLPRLLPECIVWLSSAHPFDRYALHFTCDCLICQHPPRPPRRPPPKKDTSEEEQPNQKFPHAVQLPKLCNLS